MESVQSAAEVLSSAFNVTSVKAAPKLGKNARKHAQREVDAATTAAATAAASSNSIATSTLDRPSKNTEDHSTTVKKSLKPVEPKTTSNEQMEIITIDVPKRMGKNARKKAARRANNAQTDNAKMKGAINPSKEARQQEVTPLEIQSCKPIDEVVSARAGDSLNDEAFETSKAAEHQKVTPLLRETFQIDATVELTRDMPEESSKNVQRAQWLEMGKAVHTS